MDAPGPQPGQLPGQQPGSQPFSPPGDGGREVMDAGWSYSLEDPRDPRLSHDGVRLTAGGEDSVSQVLFDRIEAHEQVVAWHKAQLYRCLAHAAQLPVPPSSGGPLPGAVDLTAHDSAVAELAALLGLSRPQADGMLGMAILLSTLPRFLRMMETGQLDENRAVAVARAMAQHLPGAGHPDPRWTAVEERVAARVGRH